MKRITVPGLPHHVIQRGLQGRQTFLSENDYAVYLGIMAERCMSPREVVEEPAK